LKFQEVDVDELEDYRESHRGRVSYPILKSFLETGMVCAKLDRTGIQQSLMTLQMCLRSYIKNHCMPIKIFTRKNEIYLLRLDLNKDGSPNPDWNKQDPEAQAIANAEEAPELDDDLVEQNFGIEKNQYTK
jgi:hypothetical protein